MNSVSDFPCALSERAARLHAYVSQKHPRFSLKNAESVVTDLKPYWFEPTKVLAKRLRIALSAKTVNIGHESSLHATARLQGSSDYFHAPKKPNALEVAQFGVGAVAPISYPDWRACVRVMVEACEHWLDTHPSSHLLRLEVSPNDLAIYGVASEVEVGMGSLEPIAAVRPLEGGTWLEGAASSLESLRRRVEESRVLQ
jgi:hypothetical protein